MIKDNIGDNSLGRVSFTCILPILPHCFTGIDEISVDAYKGEEHSDSEDSDKSDSSDSEYGSEEEQKMKDSSNAAPSEEVQKESTKAKVKDQPSPCPDREAEGPVGPESATDDAAAAPSDSPTKETKKDQDKESLELAKASQSSPAPREKLQMKEEKKHPVSVEDSDSERELVIDLGEEQGGRDKKRGRRDHTTMKESSAGKSESEICSFFFHTAGVLGNTNTKTEARFPSHCKLNVSRNVDWMERHPILFRTCY